MTPEKWVLEIYLGHSLISRLEFDNIPALRTAVVENRGQMFIVKAPAHATAADRITLLDLRAQGFDIAIGPPA
jgi:hypothetical protein